MEESEVELCCRVMRRDGGVKLSLWLVLQGNEERWRSEGDGTESSNRQLASVSNLTQVTILLLKGISDNR